MNELIISLPHSTNKFNLRKVPRSFQSYDRTQSAEMIVNKPKSIRLPVFFMVTEHVAV